jgi:hypothetical protein
MVNLATNNIGSIDLLQSGNWNSPSPLAGEVANHGKDDGPREAAVYVGDASSPWIDILCVLGKTARGRRVPASDIPTSPLQ